MTFQTAGNGVQFHVSGLGVQIYVWTVNPTNAALSSWVFKAPHPVLFGTEKDEKGDVVGIHFGGPTWESNSGSALLAPRHRPNWAQPTSSYLCS